MVRVPPPTKTGIEGKTRLLDNDTKEPYIQGNNFCEFRKETKGNN